MSLTTIIRAAISGVLKGTADFGTPNYPLPFHSEIILKNGTGSNQADLLFSDQRSLNASANEEHNLTGGLTDPLGQTLTFVKVKAILIRAAIGNGGNIVVGGATANAFLGPFADATDKINIPAGGVLQLAAPAAGWAVTGGTGDLLRIENSDGGAAATYDIVLVGTSS